MHKLADVIFGVIQKLLYITKLGQVMHHYYRNFSERLVTSFRLLFSFIIMSIKRGWVRKKKINLTFLRLFNNPLSKYLIFRIISCMKCLFWVIYQNWKWDWDSRLVHIFSIKILLIKFSINWQSSNVRPFFLLKISNKMCY